MKLAEYVLDYRERHNLSQRDFARQCGCSFQYISKLERNEVTNPSKKMMSKLAYGMGMDLTTLYALIDDYGRIPGTDIPSGSNETVRRIAEKLRSLDADELDLIETAVDAIIRLHSKQ